MIATLLSNIKTKLEACTKVQAVYDHPLEKDEQFTGFPAVVFFPDNFSNDFLSNKENMRGYNIAMLVVVECNIKTQSQAITILADAVDEILAKFDTGWDGGNSDGHRIWQKVDLGRWEFSVDNIGATIIAPLNLIIKVAVNS